MLCERIILTIQEETLVDHIDIWYDFLNKPPVSVLLNEVFRIGTWFEKIYSSRLFPS